MYIAVTWYMRLKKVKHHEMINIITFKIKEIAPPPILSWKE